MTTPIRVLLADDQQMIRAGLRVILDHEPDIDVVGEADDGLQACSAAIDLRPDIVLMDIRMPRRDGIAATRAIKADPRSAECRVIALTTFDDDEYLAAALKAGAAGFLLKDATPTELLNAIKRVHAGDALLDPSLTQQVLNQWVGQRPDHIQTGALSAAVARLSPREHDVWRLVASGASNKDIAAALYLTEGTVKTHVHSLLTKLDSPSRSHLVTLAYESGLVRPGSGA